MFGDYPQVQAAVGLPPFARSATAGERRLVGNHQENR